MISQAIKSRFPEGYWPSTMDASAQYRSMDDFTRAIYPIWKGIGKKDWEAENGKMVDGEMVGGLTQAQVAAPGQCLFEVQTTHKQDNAIFAAGIKPHRSDMAQEKMQNIRQKAARAAGVRTTTYED